MGRFTCVWCRRPRPSGIRCEDELPEGLPPRVVAAAGATQLPGAVAACQRAKTTIQGTARGRRACGHSARSGRCRQAASQFCLRRLARRRHPPAGRTPRSRRLTRQYHLTGTANPPRIRRKHSPRTPDVWSFGLHRPPPPSRPPVSPPLPRPTPPPTHRPHAEVAAPHPPIPPRRNSESTQNPPKTRQKPSRSASLPQPRKPPAHRRRTPPPTCHPPALRASLPPSPPACRDRRRFERRKRGRRPGRGARCSHTRAGARAHAHARARAHARAHARARARTRARAPPSLCERACVRVWVSVSV